MSQALAGEFVINDHNAGEFVDKEEQGFRTGMVPRDYSQHPVGTSSGAVAFSDVMEIIDRVEWPERCAEQAANESSLDHIRDRGNNGQPIPALDQNGQGFCWAYSTGAGIQLARAKAGLPYKQLSPHAVACKIYNHQDRGAWGALSFDFGASEGFPTTATWPEKSMERRFDNKATWEEAKTNRITEGWIDLDVDHVSESQLTFDQMATCYFNLFPVICDFNWWGHSVCGMRLMDAKPELGQQGLDDPNRWCNKIINSWRNTWGKNGTAVLQGKKAIPNGGCAIRTVTAG